VLRRTATILEVSPEFALAIALVVSLAFASAASAETPARAGESVTPAALSAQLARGDAPQLLDVRTPEEFAAGHLPGAVLIPHDALALRLDELDRGRPVVVYCRTGRRAAIAEDLLRQRGFEVSQLPCSWLAWQAAGLPQEPAAKAPAPAGEGP
jgi:rhodanese-related sulfurtransferase